jgi:hypothetical protein
MAEWRVTKEMEILLKQEDGMNLPPSGSNVCIKRSCFSIIKYQRNWQKAVYPQDRIHVQKS